MTTRRQIVLTLGAGALAVPFTSFAQQAPAKVWRVGLFHVGLDHVPPALDGIREGLKALGYEEGRNITFDFRNLADLDAARTTAREFVLAKVDLIVALRWCKEAGIDGRCATHTLRKTFVRLQHTQFGTPLSVLMKALNHSSEAQTLTYVGLLSEDVDRIYSNPI